MKKLILLSLLFAAPFAHAGKIKEVLIMAEDAVIEQLYSEGDNTLTFSEHGLDTATSGDLMVHLNVESRNVHNGRITRYKCAVTFQKTVEFFEVSNTSCH